MEALLGIQSSGMPRGIMRDSKSCLYLQVPLEKGYSQVDWMKLTRQLEVAPPRRDITLAEVRQHKTPDDAWMIFHNRVSFCACL